MDQSEQLIQLEVTHLASFCIDSDCWCKDEEYWQQRLGENY